MQSFIPIKPIFIAKPCFRDEYRCTYSAGHQPTEINAVKQQHTLGINAVVVTAALGLFAFSANA
ncbi:MAG: hypothetical protein ACRETL_04860, partial [Gammaproteobacteria bacterium]